MTLGRSGRRFVRLGALVALVTIAITLWHQRYRDSLPPRDIESLMETERIAGAVMAIRNSDGSIRTRLLGQSVTGSRQIDATSRFPIASLSKPLTASAVRRLVAKGLLDLDKPVHTLLPELDSGIDSRFGQITARHLLQHTSGLSQRPSDPMFAGGHVAGCDRAIEISTLNPLESAPGSRTRYSNVGYCLLGRLIERVTGLDYAVAVPLLLELADTNMLTLGPPSALPHQAHGIPDKDWKLIGAAGGWFSDAETLARIFSSDARDSSIPASPVQSGHGRYHYGLGWRVWPIGNDHRLTHFGILPGMFSMAVAYPDGCSAVILMNGSPRAGESFARHLSAFLDKELGHSSQPQGEGPGP